MGECRMINTKLETIQGKYGPFQALIISGDTRPVSDQLKNLGFRWYPQKAVWWMASKNVTPHIKEALDKLGTTSELTPPQAPQTPQTPEQHKEQREWVSEEPEMTRWYKFPINKNIRSFQEITTVDGKDYKADITIDRSYVMGGDVYHKTKSREHIKKPKYVIHVTVPEVNSLKNPGQPIRQAYKHVSKQLWGSYDEDTLLDTTIKDLVKNVLTSPDKIPGLIRYVNEIEKRTPEYKQFLNDIGKDKIFPTFNITIDDPKYKGTYQVAVASLGVDDKCLSVYLDTKLEQEGVPRAATVAYQVSIEGTYTIDDFNNKIQSFINNEGHEEIKENYIKYLKSFPYLQEQKAEASQSIEDIRNILNNPQGSITKVLEELKSRGYIRPSKRQKQYTGLTLGEEIIWIIDSKKIVHDAYSYGSYLAHTPDYFYAVVAYYIHRKHKNISSWTDMMLVDSMEIWRSSMERYNIKLSFKEIDRVISSIGSAIYNSFKGSTESEKTTTQENITGALKEFANLAQKYGISVEDVENNVKNIYRTLTKLLHPDMFQDPKEKEQKTEEFKQLQNLYDAIPQQYKMAYSWYDRYIESRNREIFKRKS